MMLLAHKLELKPNNKQATYFKKACGVARFSYNWALAMWQEQYKKGERPTEISLRKLLNAHKTEEFPWMQEVTKNAPQQAIKNLGAAFNLFFKGKAKYPKFKKKGKVKDSFRADNGPSQKGSDAVRIIGKKIQVPCLGWVKMTENLRFKGQIKSLIISRVADKWFATIAVDMESIVYGRKNHASVGIDLGVKALATLSNGKVITGAKSHTRLLKRLKRQSRKLSVKKKQTMNSLRQARKLAKTHARIANIRRDYLHKATTDIVLNHSKIGIENLNVKGMSANRKLARHILDQSFYEFRRQLEYKSVLYGSQIFVADKFFPSSKLCHNCGYVYADLKLSERTWTCLHCNQTHDRDLNAALNLQRLCTPSSGGDQACGVESSGSFVLKMSETVYDEAGIQHHS